MQRRILATVITVFGFAAAANAADNIYMVIPGVTGTVTAVGFVGAIEIFSFSQGLANVNGTVTCSDVSLQKLVDQTSAFFARSVLEQRGPFNATLYFVPPAVGGGPAVANTIIKLKTTTVTSVSHGAAEGGAGFLNLSRCTRSLSWLALTTARPCRRTRQTVRSPNAPICPDGYS